MEMRLGYTYREDVGVIRVLAIDSDVYKISKYPGGEQDYRLSGPIKCVGVFDTPAEAISACIESVHDRYESHLSQLKDELADALLAENADQRIMENTDQ